MKDTCSDVDKTLCNMLTDNSTEKKIYYTHTAYKSQIFTLDIIYFFIFSTMKRIFPVYQLKHNIRGSVSNKGFPTTRRKIDTKFIQVSSVRYETKMITRQTHESKNSNAIPINVKAADQQRSYDVVISQIICLNVLEENYFPFRLIAPFPTKRDIRTNTRQWKKLEY